MTIRRLLVGLILLALVSLAWLGRLDSGDNREAASVSLPPDATSTAATSAEPQAEFADADLVSGLAALCSADAANPAENVPSDAYEQAIQAMSERLAVSSSAEHLLTAALIQPDLAAQVDLIKRAVAASPADPLILWSAVRLCSDTRENSDCPLREWEERLIAVDRENSEAWVRIASNRYAAGEVSAALDAMRFASTAAESRIYWVEMIESIERGLRALGELDFPMRANHAIGIAATELPSYSGLTTMCGEQSAGSAEWADACLRYGELAERQGKTVIGVSIARSVQRLVLELTGESEKVAEVEQRIQAGDREFGDSAGRLNATAGQLLVTNPTLFYSYLAATRSDGENFAMRRVTAEIERLIRQRPELACE